MDAVLPVRTGEIVTFAKTVGESDVYLFAGITGDLSPNHINEEKMKQSRFGGRVVHGALLMGFMSCTSTMLIERCLAATPGWTAVALGYDRVRFVAPVRIGDTVNVRYEVVGIDPERARSTAEIGIANQHGETVAVATGLLKWTRNPESPA